MIVDRLNRLLPELEYSRETHVQWSSTSDEALARNPEIGSRDFHQQCIADYDERIAAIKEAATALAASQAQVAALNDMLRTFLGDVQVQDWTEASDEEAQETALRWINRYHDNKRAVAALQAERDLLASQLSNSRTDVANRDGWLLTAHESVAALQARCEALDEVRDEILNKLEGWGKAYPVDIFHEPTKEERDWLHATKPGLMDCIAASMGRHMAKCIEQDIAALRAAIDALLADVPTVGVG